VDIVVSELKEEVPYDQEDNVAAYLMMAFQDDTCDFRTSSKEDNLLLLDSSSPNRGVVRKASWDPFVYPCNDRSALIQE